MSYSENLNQFYFILSTQWKMMAQRCKEEAPNEVGDLLLEKDQLVLPLESAKDFLLAMRLSKYYCHHLPILKEGIEQVFYKELIKAASSQEDSRHLLDERKFDEMVTGVYKNLDHVTNKTREEHILFHLLRSSPNNLLFNSKN